MRPTDRSFTAGALKKAAESTQAERQGAGGDDSTTRSPARRVAVSIVEAYGKEVEPRELEATLRMEYRSKLLNPKWADAMSKQVRSQLFLLSGCNVLCAGAPTQRALWKKRVG